MRIAVFTDAHANLPATRAALDAIQREGADLIYHTGDAIGIGPYPAETLDLLLGMPNMRFVMGNHDAYLVDGLTPQHTRVMDADEIEHQRWTHAQISTAVREAVAQWPYRTTLDAGGVRVAFLHYALDASGHGFSSIFPLPDAPTADMAFSALLESESPALVCFGHTHQVLDVAGRARYLNPGALGAHTEAVARYFLIEAERGQARVMARAVSYDRAPLLRAFEEREVPARAFLLRAFFGVG